MPITTEPDNKPDLSAKVCSEAPRVTMETPPLPEFYHDQVCKNLCVVSVAKAAEKSQGGIILAETSKEASNYASQIGRIEAIGPKFYSEKRWGEGTVAPVVGDLVMFTPYVGRRLELGGNEFLIIEDTDILLKKLRDTDDFKLYT